MLACQVFVYVLKCFFNESIVFVSSTVFFVFKYNFKSICYNVSVQIYIRIFIFLNVIHKNYNRIGTVICLNTPLNYVSKLIVYCRFLPLFNINGSKIL